MHLPEFEALGLAPHCLDALAHEGYEKPTPIQAQAIPPLLQGRDILGCAQTGTGKTAAFALPTIQHLMANKVKHEKYKARALVVAPTRELAIQIDASFAAYGRGAGLKRACVYGGVGKVPQIKAMERGVDVLVATPGRLLDLRNEGAIDLSMVEIAVLDEADRMLDMGFIHDVRKIVALLPKKRQTLLFSATMPPEIEDLARGFLRDPVHVAIEPEKPAVELIAQSLYYVEKGAKRELLTHLIRELKVTKAVVFSRTKHGADRIAKGLHVDGIPAGVIHANKGQGNRTKTMDAFRSGETAILVATDLAARGIDVDDISHVFNFDQPTEPETYVHRIGRTARAGASGTAISFCDTEEKKFLKQVERLLGKPIPVVKDHPFTHGSGKHAADEEEDRAERRYDERRQGGRRDGGRQAQGRQDPGRQGGAPRGQGRAAGAEPSRNPSGGGSGSQGDRGNSGRGGRGGQAPGLRGGDRPAASGRQGREPAGGSGAGRDQPRSERQSRPAEKPADRPRSQGTERQAERPARTNVRDQRPSKSCSTSRTGARSAA